MVWTDVSPLQKGILYKLGYELVPVPILMQRIGETILLFLFHFCFACVVILHCHTVAQIGHLCDCVAMDINNVYCICT